MENKFKLCVVDTYGKSRIQPVDENGNDCGDVLCEYESDGECSYSIYKNYGTEDNADWQEWGFYGTDFAEALKDFKKLQGEE